MEDAINHKSRVHQLYFIGAFLQEIFNHRVFVKLDSRYADYFPEYSNYFRRNLILLKSMYGIANHGKLFYDELTEWLVESDFIQSQCQMSIYYKFAPDGTKLLFYLMLMTLYIGILLKLSENGLWMLWERRSMQNSWDMHICSCQS